MFHQAKNPESTEKLEIIHLHKMACKDSMACCRRWWNIHDQESHGPGNPCHKVIIESDADTLAKEKIKTVKIIEIDDEEADVPSDTGEKSVKQKVVIMDEEEKAEKTMLQESPAKTEKSSKKIEIG